MTGNPEKPDSLIIKNSPETTIERKQHLNAQTSNGGRRIARNTLMLYIRQMLIMLVNLYTVKVVLNVMGVVDYGIYNVVAGVVTMCGFLSGAMATASQRFFSYELGRSNNDVLRKTFVMSINIYLIVALLVFIVAETIGLWFVNTELVIPPERMTAAIWIYQSSIASFLATLLSTPYVSVIIARENMDVYAFASVAEAVIKFFGVCLLVFSPVDKLKLFGVLVLGASIARTTVFVLVCRKRYPESRYSLFWDWGMFRVLFSYTGWNLFGASVSVIKIQAVNILLNVFFGPVVNAARGIAAQVHSAVVSCSQNFSTAVRPQIIKRYAAEEKENMLKLVFSSSKMTAFLMYIFVLPLYLEMTTVMELWLGRVPDYVVLFTRLVLIDALIESTSYPLMTAVQATGRIRLYQSLVGGALLLNLPFSYFFLQLGFPPESVLIVAIVIAVVAYLLRLGVLRQLMSISLKQYFLKTIVPAVTVLVVSFVVAWIIQIWMDAGVVRLVIVTMVSTFSILASVCALGLTAEERFALIRKTRVIRIAA